MAVFLQIEFFPRCLPLDERFSQWIDSSTAAALDHCTLTGRI
jgi:hypothetical protein